MKNETAVKDPAISNGKAFSPLGREDGRSARALFLRLVRLYTYNTPIDRGKYRLFQLALSLVKSKPKAIASNAKDGRRFISDLTTGMEEMLFFLGEYEPFISGVARRLIRPGDVCLDVGANFGWYTTMMATLSGEAGEVHSFEPVPQTFLQLERNVGLLDGGAAVSLNNMALGDRDDTLKINVFEGLTSGHASLNSDGEYPSVAFDCTMTTLDKYLSERAVEKVSFVKVDIEGAELIFLQGAEKLFSQAQHPIFLMEMALAQTKRFGYRPNDLLKFLAERGRFDFYKADEIRKRLVPIDHFEDDDIGANVFCIPETAADGCRAAVAEYL